MSITPLPSAPAVTDTTAEFNTKAFEWVAALADFTTEANALADQVNVDAEIAAQGAEASAAAIAAANFKGAWSTLTGPLNIPASVSHNNVIYALTQNLANVTTDEPGVTSPSKWLLLTVPNQAGKAGKFLSTNGFVESWESIPEPVLIKKPTNVSPANATAGINETLTLTGSTYYSLYGVTMAASQWQVSTVSNFSTTVINSGDRAGTSVSYAIGSGILSVSTTYYWRVRYKDSDGVYSEWSTPTSFITRSAWAPSIGASFAGGYYGGEYELNGSIFYLVCSPKASGQTTKQWKTSNTDSPGAASFSDGKTNTNNINNSSHPAAQFCTGLTIGGYSDWYLPSTSEQNVFFSNLRQSKAGIPAIFQAGGSESFDVEWYWTSTQVETNANQAYVYAFQSSNLTAIDKTSINRTRAIRKVAI